MSREQSGGSDRKYAETIFSAEARRDPVAFPGSFSIQSASELSAVVRHQLGLTLGDFEDGEDLLSRFAVLPVPGPVHDFEQLVEGLTIARRARVQARQRKTRFMIGGIRRELRLQFRLARRTGRAGEG